MQVSVLASGSKGNATYIEIDGIRILIDAGISATRIKKNLRQIGVGMEDLNAILLTHEHIDHIRALPTLCKHYHIPLYSRAETFNAMPFRSEIEATLLHTISKYFSLGSISIEAFNTSHDAAAPVGYRLQGRKNTCTLATDLGFVSTAVQSALNSDILVLESNYDPELLHQNRKYPPFLKARIRSKKGHLSNLDAAWAISRLQNVYHIILAHMSAENNLCSIAQKTIFSILQQQQYFDRHKTTFTFAKQDNPVSVIY